MRHIHTIHRKSYFLSFVVSMLLLGKIFLLGKTVSNSSDQPKLTNAYAIWRKKQLFHQQFDYVFHKILYSFFSVIIYQGAVQIQPRFSPWSSGSWSFTTVLAVLKTPRSKTRWPAPEAEVTLRSKALQPRPPRPLALTGTPLLPTRRDLVLQQDLDPSILIQKNWGIQWTPD